MLSFFKNNQELFEESNSEMQTLSQTNFDKVCVLIIDYIKSNNFENCPILNYKVKFTEYANLSELTWNFLIKDEEEGQVLITIEMIKHQHIDYHQSVEFDQFEEFDLLHKFRNIKEKLSLF